MNTRGREKTKEQMMADRLVDLIYPNLNRESKDNLDIVTDKVLKVMREEKETKSKVEELDGVSTYTEKECKADTLKHIREVQSFMKKAIAHLEFKSSWHDDSKLREPELSIFTKYTPKLKNTTYGSEEYKSYLREMKVGLEHHYVRNSHHPEHYGEGIGGMSLFDLIEMICDWMAATLRHEDGDINASLELNKVRFGINGQLQGILENTVRLYQTGQI